MKVFRGSYQESWSYGGFQDYEFIIIANTKSEALGLAMEQVNTGTKADWEITEIDTSKPVAIETYDRGC